MNWSCFAGPVVEDDFASLGSRDPLSSLATSEPGTPSSFANGSITSRLTDGQYRLARAHTGVQLILSIEGL